MKKIKFISTFTAVIIILMAFSTFVSINTVNAATTQASVAYGKITDKGVEVTVKFSRDISEDTFDSKWEKVDTDTIKATLAEGTYAYVKVESSNGDKEEGIIAVPVKMQEKEVLDMTSKDSDITLSNLKSEDTSIATVSSLKVTAVKEGKTKITGDVKFSSDDETKKCTWDLTVTKKEETKPVEEKPIDEKQTEEELDGEKTIEEKTNDSNINDTDKDNSENNVKVELTKEEIKEIEDFINDEKLKNTGFLFINYTNPEEIVKKIANENEGQYLDVSAIDTLRYAIIDSGYGKEATNEQLIKIYGSLDGANGTTILMTEEDLINFFKDRINYEYTAEKIKNDLKEHYKDNLGLYAFNASDILYQKFEIKSGYKIGNKYYIEIEYKNVLTENKTETINLVMTKVNGRYTFYSCDNSAINGTYNKKDEKDETTADGKIPQTGVDNTILWAIGVGAIIAIAGIIRYKNIKYKSKC